MSIRGIEVETESRCKKCGQSLSLDEVSKHLCEPIKMELEPLSEALTQMRRFHKENNPRFRVEETSANRGTTVWRTSNNTIINPEEVEDKLLDMQYKAMPDTTTRIFAFLWRCESCHSIHVTADDAQECCDGEIRQVWVFKCPYCGAIESDFLESALECCSEEWLFEKFFDSSDGDSIIPEQIIRFLLKKVLL